MRDLVFIDVETTGLDVSRHELLEVGAVRVTHDLSRVVIGPFAMKVRPERLEDADPAALELVGYSEEEWRSAAPVGVMLEWLWPLLRDATPAGHNVTFDLAFLDAAARAAGKSGLPVDYHRLDTASLAWLLTQSGESEKVSLQPVCDALGIERARSHRALDDVLASLEVARRVRELFVHPRIIGIDRGDPEGDATVSLVTGPGGVVHSVTPSPRILPLPRKFGGDA